jgi:hypothetical protein
VLAGATAVAVGTAIFGDPGAPVRVLGELEQLLHARGFGAVRDAVGRAHRPDAVDARPASRLGPLPEPLPDSSPEPSPESSREPLPESPSESPSESLPESVPDSPPEPERKTTPRVVTFDDTRRS